MSVCARASAHPRTCPPLCLPVPFSNFYIVFFLHNLSPPLHLLLSHCHFSLSASLLPLPLLFQALRDAKANNTRKQAHVDFKRPSIHLNTQGLTPPPSTYTHFFFMHTRLSSIVTRKLTYISVGKNENCLSWPKTITKRVLVVCNTAKKKNDQKA